LPEPDDERPPAALGPRLSNEVELLEDFFTLQHFIEGKQDLPFAGGVWIAAVVCKILVSKANAVRGFLLQRELKWPETGLLKALLGEMQSHEIGITIDSGHVFDDFVPGVPGAKKSPGNPSSALFARWV